MDTILKDFKLTIIGLGYIALPLAVEFGKKRPVVGVNINQKRIAELQAEHAHTLELASDDLPAAKLLNLTTKIRDPHQCNCIIVAVQMPIASDLIQAGVEQAMPSYIKNVYQGVAMTNLITGDVVVKERKRRCNPSPFKSN